MNKKYFLYVLTCVVLILGGFGLSYAINSSLSNLSNTVERVDMNNLLPDETIISESESSQSDDQVPVEQLPPAALAENNPADESVMSDLLKEFSLLKEIHSSIVELVSNVLR